MADDLGCGRCVSVFMSVQLACILVYVNELELFTHCEGGHHILKCCFL